MHGIDKLRAESRTLAMVFGVVFAVVALWLFGDVSYVPLKQFGAALATPEADAVATAAAYGRIVVQVLPVVLMLGALWSARDLFRQFAAGDVFTPASGAKLGRIGDWLIAGAVAGIVASPAVEIVTSAGAPTDLRFDHLSLAVGCVGLAIRLIGRAFVSAAEIKAENDQIL